MTAVAVIFLASGTYSYACAWYREARTAQWVKYGRLSVGVSARISADLHTASIYTSQLPTISSRLESG